MDRRLERNVGRKSKSSQSKKRSDQIERSVEATTRWKRREAHMTLDGVIENVRGSGKLM